MFFSRRLNQETGRVEVWECEWSNPGTGMAKKQFIRKYADEEDVAGPVETYSAAAAVCWAPGRTIGNIAVSSEEVFGSFEGKSGTNATLPCHIVPCGKFRNGAKRWYCKTHQMHWGTRFRLAGFDTPNCHLYPPLTGLVRRCFDGSMIFFRLANVTDTRCHVLSVRTLRSICRGERPYSSANLLTVLSCVFPAFLASRYA